MGGEAIAIDKAFAEPHSSLGHAHFHEYDWADAEREFQQSIALNSNYPSAHSYYALYLVAMGRHDEAVAEAKKALALDPASLAAQTNLAIIHYRAGRYDEAVTEARRVLDLDTNYAHAHYVLGRDVRSKTKVPRSSSVIAKSRNSGREQRALHGVAGLYLWSHRKRKNAFELLGKIKHIMVQRNVPAYMLAICYAGLGNKDEALVWLANACAEHSAESPFVNVDPRLAALRVDPRFRRILRKLGLKR